MQHERPRFVEDLGSSHVRQRRHPLTHSAPDEQLVEEEVELDSSASSVGPSAAGRQAGSGLSTLLVSVGWLAGRVRVRAN